MHYIVNENLKSNHVSSEVKLMLISWDGTCVFYIVSFIPNGSSHPTKPCGELYMQVAVCGIEIYIWIFRNGIVCRKVKSQCLRRDFYTILYVCENFGIDLLQNTLFAHPSPSTCLLHLCLPSKILIYALFKSKKFPYVKFIYIIEG
jgi:hypothetical protein